MNSAPPPMTATRTIEAVNAQPRRRGAGGGLDGMTGAIGTSRRPVGSGDGAPTGAGSGSLGSIGCEVLSRVPVADRRGRKPSADPLEGSSARPQRIRYVRTETHAPSTPSPMPDPTTSRVTSREIEPTLIGRIWKNPTMNF